MNRVSRYLSSALTFFALFATASAHNYWMKAVPNGAQICIGDAQDSDSYQRSSIETVTAFDAQGQTVKLEESFAGRLTVLSPGAVAFASKADYGTWIKTIRGWKLGSKTDSGDRVLKSAWHIQYTKLVKPAGLKLNLKQPLEIVINQATSNLLEGQVFYSGQPASDRPLYRSHDRIGKTDSQGAFSITGDFGTTGQIVISTDVEEELQNHPHADRKITTATLTLAP